MIWVCCAVDDDINCVSVAIEIAAEKVKTILSDDHSEWIILVTDVGCEFVVAGGDSAVIDIVGEVNELLERADLLLGNRPCTSEKEDAKNEKNEIFRFILSP